MWQRSKCLLPAGSSTQLTSSPSCDTCKQTVQNVGMHSNLYDNFIILLYGNLVYSVQYCLFNNRPSLQDNLIPYSEKKPPNPYLIHSNYQSEVNYVCNESLLRFSFKFSRKSTSHITHKQLVHTKCQNLGRQVPSPS